jgi:phosphoglycerate dehydrogenase-like enzyme
MNLNVLPVGVPDDCLARLFSNERINVVTAPSMPSLNSVDALLYWLPDRDFGRELMGMLGDRLKWVHVPWVGVEKLLTDRVVSGDVLLTNSRGAASMAVAEYVMSGILAISKDLPRHIRSSSQRSLDFAPTREIRGQRVLIVGLGDIGKAVARHARHFGMNVRAVTRTPAAYWACESVRPVDALEEEVRLADYAVLSVPSTSRTRHLFDQHLLGCMQQSAWLINVARADVVDQAALVRALAASSIGGAVLDVFDPEPLDEKSPLWSLPNTVLTPHVSSWTKQRFERAFRIFEKNIPLFLGKKPLTNQVNVNLGY